VTYYTKVLGPDETIYCEGHLHWLVYAKALISFGLAVFLITVSLLDVHELPPDVGIVVAAIALFSLGSFVSASVRRATTEIVVTDRRVIYKTGIFSRHAVEINASKIETIDVDQNIIGLVLGFGTISIRGTGGEVEHLRRVADPIKLRNAILPG
jgi:uncharacterized membrane protein YdbT with pleckstrin-like domain